MRADHGVHMAHGDMTSLLSTVYSQSWPAPDPVRGPRRGFSGKRPNNTDKPNRVQSRPKSAATFLQIQGRTINRKSKDVRSKSAIGVRTLQSSIGGDTSRSSINGQLGLDKSTLHWKSWSSYKGDCVPDAESDLSLYKLTSDTFRRLSQQVKDVDQQLSGKYHNSGFKSYYVVGDGEDKTVVPALRRTQLAASLPLQRPSICSPTPHEIVSFRPSEDLQCTTVRSTPRKKRPQSSFVRPTQPKVKHKPRPKSSHATILGNSSSSSSTSSLSGSIKDGDLNDNYDQVNPKVIEKLAEGEDKDFVKSQPGPFDIVREAEKPKPESDDDQEGSCSDEEETSDDDEEDYRTRSMPDFDLPPEELNIEDFQGQFGYYHTSNMPKKKQPDHPKPLRAPWCHMDLLGLSEMRNWRREIKMVPEGDEEHIMERMIEMERIQANTAHWEKCQGKGSARPPTTLQVRKGWNADAAVPTERAHNALSKPKQSKNCREDCMQQACAGECRLKDPGEKGCHHCKQSYCKGDCTEYDYHLYVRTERADDDDIPARPKFCKSCAHARNSAASARASGKGTSSVKSTINANSVVLGRPKSAFATFSSVGHQPAKPKALGVSQTAGAEKVFDELARLGLSAPVDNGAGGDAVKQRPHTAKARLRPKGRDAIQPGKSFQSQRRNSLTEEWVTTSAVRMNSRAMRARSARARAQKRCQSAKK